MAELKPISKESIPGALAKAERYRLLNEPFCAESICLDVLAVEPDNQRALVTYVLAVADQFSTGAENTQRARAAIEKIEDEHDRYYYAGIIAERRGTAILERGGYGAGAAAWHHIQDAMTLYDKADPLQKDPNNDDAVLRYNTCLRLIEAHRLTEPARDDHTAAHDG
jgi:hypothetical protein